MLNKILKHVFNLLCLTLFLINFAFLTVEYMKYTTDTNAGPILPVKMVPPRTSLCFRTNFLINSIVENTFFDQSVRLYLNWTVKSLFDSLPEPSSLIKWCQVRSLKSNVQFTRQLPRECNQFFNLTRYRLGGHICYRIEYKYQQRYAYNEIVNSIHNRRELYHVSINSPFDRAQFIKPLLHVNEFPIEDEMFNKEVYLGRSHTKLARLSYDLYQISSLPAPYETKCHNESRLSCIQGCIADKLRREQLTLDVSLNLDISSDLTLTIVDSKSLGWMQGNSSDNSCYEQCQFETCELDLVKTSVSFWPSNEMSLFVVETMMKPVIKLKRIPKVILIDYLTQTAGIIGVWLGLSFVSLTKLFQQSQPLSVIHKKLLHLQMKMQFVTSKLSNNESVHFWLKRTKPRFKSGSRTVRKLNWRRVIDVIYKLIVLLLFVWQVVNVLVNFFAYSTTVRFSYNLYPPLQVPNLILCFYISQFYKLSYTLNSKKYKSFYSALDAKTNLTMKQLLNNWHLEEYVESCYLRNFVRGHNSFDLLDKSSCLEAFQVKKFFSTFKFCFHIKVTNSQGNFALEQLVTCNPGILWAVNLNEKFRFAKKLWIVSGFGSLDIPNESMEYPAFYYDFKNDSLILISNRVYTIHLLPPPYDTGCIRTSDRDSCLRNCYSHFERKFNRTVYSISRDEEVDMKVLSYGDLLNSSVNDYWRRTESKCGQKCTKTICSYNFTVTSIDQHLPLSNFRYTLALSSPTHPTTESFRVARTTLYDFIYQILCTASFWLGFSMVDVNPFNLLLKRANVALFTQLRAKVMRLRRKFVRFREKSNKKSKNKFTFSKWKSLLVYLLAAVGCIIHTTDSMIEYLRYQSILDIYNSLEDRTEYALTVCLDTDELLTKHSDHFKNPKVDHRANNWVNETVAWLLQSTPKSSNFLQNCHFWGLVNSSARLGHVSDRFLLSQTTEECNEIYDVKKIFIQSKVCYTAKPKKYNKWNRIQMKNAMDHLFKLYGIFVDNHLLTANFTVLVSKNDEEPSSSSAIWSPNIRLSEGEQFTVFIVSYIKYIQHLLPPPYSDEGFTTIVFDRCINLCINNKLSLLNLTLDGQDESTSNNLNFFSCIFEQNEFISRYLVQVEEKCEESCASKLNLMKAGEERAVFYVPTVSLITEMLTPNSSRTLLYFQSTDHPVITIEFKPECSLFEQIINVGSVVNTWFGISMIAIQVARRVGSSETFAQDLLDMEATVTIVRSLVEAIRAFK